MALDSKILEHFPLLFCLDQYTNDEQLVSSFNAERVVRCWEVFFHHSNQPLRPVLTAAGASPSELEALASRLPTLRLDTSRLTGEDGEVRVGSGKPMQPELAFFFRQGHGLVAR